VLRHTLGGKLNRKEGVARVRFHQKYLNILHSAIQKWHNEYLAESKKRWDNSAEPYYQGYEDGHFQATSEAVKLILQFIQNKTDIPRTKRSKKCKLSTTS